MDFNEKGFLGKAILEFSDAVEKSYPDFFDACYRMNELAQETKFDFHISTGEGQEVIAACLFMRVLQDFQAVVILARLGLMIDAKIVLRAMLEVVFLLKLACEDKEFVAEYTRTSEAQRLKWMNVAHESKDPVFQSIRAYAAPERMKALRDENDKYGVKDLRIEDVARRANLHHWYNNDYRLLSAEVHAFPRSLEHYISTNQKGEITDLPWEPSDAGLPYVLFVAARTLFGALVYTTELFKVDLKTQLEKIDQTLKQLAPLLK
jgi:hypothetical protein